MTQSSKQSWISISDRPKKRSRADLACEYCHSKKIKCDLSARLNQHQSSCTNCKSVRECRIRPSRRANSGRRPKVPRTDTASQQNIDDVLNVNFDASTSLPPQPASTSTSAINLPPVQITGNQHAILSPPTISDSVKLSSVHEILPPPMSERRLSAHGSQMRANSISSVLHSTISPNQESLESRFEQSQQVDSGYNSIYAIENSNDARNQEHQTSVKISDNIDDFPDQDLLQIFIETYYEHCYAWCPVIDRSTIAYESSASAMLANALALVGSHIKPPMLGIVKPEGYYNRARRKFYDDEEPDTFASLKALSLFYWWSPRPPSTIHRHSSWWWQSIIIRHCQWMGIHREPPLHSPLRVELDLSIRRRIWWTAFARERLTAICQGRPAIIDPDDCNIQECTLDDFEDSEKPKGEVFIYWVRLCKVIGRIAKYTSRSPGSTSGFPSSLAQELIEWVNSLPAHLQLPIGTRRTENFNRDVHQLHLPYLTMVIILHLKKSTNPYPQAYPPAILAASCLTRILKDILARSDTRYLVGITCWYTATAFMALRHASRTENLRKDANEELDILEIMMDQLRKMWPTGDIFHAGFKRLRGDLPPQGEGVVDNSEQNNLPPVTTHSTLSLDPLSTGTDEIETYDGGSVKWTSYFPFASAQTSTIAEKLLTPEPLSMDDFFTAESFPDGTDLDFGPFFEPFDGFLGPLDNFT